ncbi:uncharacterized protein [Diabrotica undecimpunctata]|uniref:uncharacterized protein n=1 Tax=Diabrotica undecimpunctata TaxID=50387 RepID=UPI003B63F26B
MPCEWSQRVICPLRKNGDQLQCDNYRGITLLTTAYKIPTSENNLYERLQVYTVGIFEKYQAGYTLEKSTIDQIHSLRPMVEKTLEFNIETHHLFVDFKAVYDSVKKTILYQSMREFGLLEKLSD